MGGYGLRIHRSRYCKACGAHLRQTSAFCPQCGSAVDHNTVTDDRVAREPLEAAVKASNQWRGVIFDPSTLVLVASNIIVIIFALREHWDLMTLLWIYWAQSVIIGIFDVRKMLDLTTFSTEGCYVNGRPVAATKETQRRTALFFTLHYGFFHLVYFIFLIAFTFVNLFDMPSNSVAASSPLFIFTSIGLFFINHLYSYEHNRKEERNRTYNIGSMMFIPYARIIPMQLILILGVLLADEGPVAAFPCPKNDRRRDYARCRACS